MVPNVAHAFPADTIGRVELATLIVIGLNTFFFLYHNIIIFEVAWQKDWIINSTIFGNSCDTSLFFGWTHNVLHGTPPSPTGHLRHTHETHTAFVGATQIGWMAAGPLALLLSFTSSRRHCGRTMLISSWLIPASGIALLAVWLEGLHMSFTCNPCIVTIMANFFMGLGMGLQWCFGLPYLMGYTRPKPHHHAPHLMSGLAFMILLGEGVGFLQSYLLEERTWLLLAAVIPIIAILPLMLCFDELLAYGHPSNKPVRGEIPSMRDGGFWCLSLFTGTLWSIVDINALVYQLTFGTFLSDIGEDDKSAGAFAFFGDLLSTAVCAGFIRLFFYGFISRCSEETQEAYSFWILVLCGFTAFVDLLATVALDAIPQRLTHLTVGIVYVIYRVCSALEYETLLELTPKLMRKKDEILHSWCLTVCIRMVVQLLVIRLIDLMLHSFSRQLWVIFLFQLVYKLVFVVCAFARLKRQPFVEGHAFTFDDHAEQDALLVNLPRP